MKLAKAKKGTKPGKDQSIRACPYCGQDILVTPNAPDAKKADGFGVALAVVALIMLAMLYLIVMGGPA